MISTMFRRGMVGCAAMALSAFGFLATSAALAGPMTGGLELWLDANDAATFTFSSGNSVSEWRDKSGNAIHAATGSNYPTLQPSVIGGRPAVSFNRTPLTVAGGVDIGANEDRTAFLVMNYSVSTQNSEIFGTGTGNMVDVGNWSSAWRLRLRQGDNTFSAANSLPAGSHLVAIQGDAAGSHAWRNGANIIDSTNKHFHWAMNANLGIGGAEFAGREYIGDLAEVLIYQGTPNRYEFNNTSAYLQDKYGLAGPYAKIAPPPIPGLALWLDSADAGTVTVDSGGNVTAWRDKSGGGHDATPLHSPPGPAWVDDAIGGLPAVEFDQSSRTVMGIAGDLDIAAGQERTLFVVMDYDTLLGNNEILGNSSGQMIDVGLWTPSGNQDERLRLRDGSLNAFSDPGDMPQGPHILVVQGNDGGSLAYLDGNLILDSPNLAFHYALEEALRIGGTDFNGRDFEGRLAEILLFDRALAYSEMAGVGNYLGQKYLIETQFVPELGSLVLLVLGGLCLVGLGWRKRAR